MDLFDTAPRPQNEEPLAARMRPRNLGEYIGQEHILGKGRLLRRAIQLDQLSSVIFYGPPGTGKTTLARVIANTTSSHFSTLNAVLSGTKDLEVEVNHAKERRDLYGTKTILFIDEVHRWNKRQQDALLPWVENGTVILIGATTENPYFEVNSALVSRSRIFQLKKLEDKDLFEIAHQAIADKERGYGNYKVTFGEGALEHLVEVASGDARSLLNALQLAVETTPDSFPPPVGTEIFITRETAEESIQKKAVLYDKEGDYHFDVISAFIKSIRGSDPDATLYWLARMVAAGEDPKFIFRRMLISAAEDVGMADPDAIRVVSSCAEAFDRIGLPEGRFHLAEAAIYLSTTKKSNTTLAFFDALKDVEEEKQREVPNHLRDASRDSEGFGHGEGYLYPHSYKDHWVSQQYLPTGLQGKVYYRPTTIGYEASIHDDVYLKREIQLESVTEDETEEILTWSPKDRKRDMWLERAMGSRSESLSRMVSQLYDGLEIRRHDNVIVLNASNGLLLWPLMKMNPEGLSAAIVKKQDQKDVIMHFSEELDELSRPLVIASEDTVKGLGMLEEGLKARIISARDPFTDLRKADAFFRGVSPYLEDDGGVYILQIIPSLSSRLSDFVDGNILKSAMMKAEDAIYSKNPLSVWGKDELAEKVKKYRKNAEIEFFEEKEKRRLTKDMLGSWWENSYASSMDEGDRESFISMLSGRDVWWKRTTAVIREPLKKKRKDPENSHEDWVEVHEITK